jgi:hypothetical protein
VRFCQPGSKADVSDCACLSNYTGDGRSCKLCRTCDAVSYQLTFCGFNSTVDTVTCGCFPGFYSPTGLDCKPCPQGTYRNLEPLCVPCGRGMYSDEVAQATVATCRACPRTTYGPFEASGNRSTVCLACPLNSSAPAAGAGWRTQCACNAGFVSNITETAGGCSVCGRNQYPSEDGRYCAPCPANTGNAGSAVGAWECKANTGFFATYTKTVRLELEVPDELSDPATVAAYVRAAAGGGEELEVVVT